MPLLRPREAFMQYPEDRRDNALLIERRLRDLGWHVTGIIASFRTPFHEINVYADFDEQYAIFDGSQVVVPRALLERLPEITPESYHILNIGGATRMRLTDTLDYGPLDDAYYQMYHEAKVIRKYTTADNSPLVISHLITHARALELSCLLFKNRLYIVYTGETSCASVEIQHGAQSDTTSDVIDSQARIPFDQSARNITLDEE